MLIADVLHEVGTETALAVTLSYIHAERQANIVEFNWQTATETGTASFNLLADSDKGLVPLNDELIPSPVIDSVETTDYQFSAETAANVYYLEEIKISGVSERYGPYNVGEALGVRTGGAVEMSNPIFLPMVANQ